MRTPLRSLCAALLAVAAPAQRSPAEPPDELGRSLREAVLEATYRVRGEGSCLQAVNPAQDMSSAFTNVGIRISGWSEARQPWTVSLSLSAWGREGALLPVEPAEPVARGRRVEYRRGSLTEWYVNDPRGVEQGFTLEERPAGENPLCLGLEVGGGVAVEVQPGGRGALLRDAERAITVSYAGLRAWDSARRELEASLALEGEGIVLRVDDSQATYPLHIDPWIATEEALLTASNGASQDLFGHSAAIDGDTAIVGAPGYDVPCCITDLGAAYVFVRNGTNWSEQQTLAVSDPDVYRFGQSVTLSGDTALIGTSSGQAYVFVRNADTWSLQQELTGNGTDDLGLVSLSGDTALIGAPNWPNGVGSAYVFTRSAATWSQQALLVGHDTEPGDLFGGNVSLDGDTAVVGAYLDDHAGGVKAGSAYVFVRSGAVWAQQAKLTASDAADFDYFGLTVALSGDTAAVGSNQDDHAGGVNAGSAYVFVRSGSAWSEQARLTASEATQGTQFSSSLAVSGDTIVAGGNLGSLKGSVYLFVRTGTAWSEQAEFIYGGTSAQPIFGSAVALSGNTALVGAYNDGATPPWGAGSCFVFRLGCPVLSYCTPGTSASGCQATISATGTPSAGATSGFSLLAAGVEGSKDGLFFFGTNGQQANPWGNGTSYQCVVPPVKRAGRLAGSGTVSQCDGTFAQDLNALWCPTCPKPALNPGAGAVVQAQLWYRDPASTSNQSTSLSDATEFCIGL